MATGTSAARATTTIVVVAAAATRPASRPGFHSEGRTAVVGVAEVVMGAVEAVSGCSFWV